MTHDTPEETKRHQNWMKTFLGGVFFFRSAVFFSPDGIVNCRRRQVSERPFETLQFWEWD